MLHISTVYILRAGIGFTEAKFIHILIKLHLSSNMIDKDNLIIHICCGCGIHNFLSLYFHLKMKYSAQPPFSKNEINYEGQVPILLILRLTELKIPTSFLKIREKEWKRGDDWLISGIHGMYGT